MISCSAEPPPASVVPTMDVPASGPMVFHIGVENRSSTPIVVSIASDTAAVMPGFEPGDRGTISIALLDPANGIGLEVLGPPPDCRLLAEGIIPTPVPIEIIVHEGARPGRIEVSMEQSGSQVTIPLPRNDLFCSGG